MRRFLPLAAVVALAAPVAAQDSVAGTWRVQGVHARLGRFAGTLDVKDGVYERNVRFADGSTLKERGRVVARPDGLDLVGDPIRGGITDGLISGKAPEPRVRVSSLSRRDGRFEGSFVVRGSDRDDRGTESLDRGGQDSFDLLVDGPAFFPRFREELARAKKSIHVETYIWKNDEVGREIGHTLAEKARSGVEVRVIVDATGGRAAHEILDEVRAAGGRVVVANPTVSSIGHDLVHLGKSLGHLVGIGKNDGESHGLLNRDHRKVLLFDGLSGYTGGMGMAKEYEGEWHDAMARFQGPIVSEVQDQFLDRWRALGGAEPVDRSRLYDDRAGLPPAGDVKLEVVASVPGKNEDGLATYLREIRGARSRILIENPYFLDSDVIDALEKKAREHVPVTVIIPADKYQDEKFVTEALHFVQNDVVKSGVDLRKYRGRMVHAKVAAIDGSWGTIGSTNLDGLSLHHLSELNVAARDARVASQIERGIFEPDIPGSDRVGPRDVSFWVKARGAVFHFLRGIL